MADIIVTGKVVTLVYRLRVSASGAIIEDVTAAYPFRFLYGSGKLLPAFEARLLGLHAGDKFSFRLPPEEAYGPHDEREVIDVPLEVFTNSDQSLSEMLRLGYFLTLTDAQGRQRVGKVMAIGGESVRMDFNHEMAGQSLYFDGTVLDIRTASSEELALGRPMM